MKTLLIAAALALGSMPAKAYTPTVCHFGFGVAVCQPLTVNPSARIIAVPEADVEGDGITETRAAWRDRCKPELTKRDPATGMRRWTWAEPGCEYGPE